MTTTYTPNKAELVWLDSAGNPTSSVYPMTVSGNTISASYLPVGTFAVKVHSSTYGYASVSPSTVTVAFSADPSISPSVTTSFVGGKQLTISGSGFVTNNPANNEITVCGLSAPVVSATESSITVSIPALVTTTTQTSYSLASNG